MPCIHASSHRKDATIARKSCCCEFDQAAEICSYGKFTLFCLSVRTHVLYHRSHDSQCHVQEPGGCAAHFGTAKCCEGAGGKRAGVLCAKLTLASFAEPADGQA